MGKTILFFDIAPGVSLPVKWQGLPATNLVMCLRYEDFLDPGRRPALEALAEQGIGVMLCGASALPEDKQLREIVTHLDVGAGDPVLIAIGRPPGRQAVHLVATRMDHWPGFEACAARKVPVMVDGRHGSPTAGGPRRALQPGAVLIVRVMQMLQRNEDVREIEAALKHDAALTYRLLRHINSPAISAGVEIHSMRHAVSMLGYTPLFRWLSLLLATSNVKTSPPFLMKRAIMRGRFVELLGQALLGPGHSDNLFLVGMFSVIDQLLGISMAELLEKVQLADPVQHAMLERKGIYGPFLALAITCETDAAEAARLTEELFISANQVNAAHLRAMQWSQEVARVDSPY
jgi:EAL and modified HD-GYP domain-containing signal transduction protein